MEDYRNRYRRLKPWLWIAAGVLVLALAAVWAVFLLRDGGHTASSLERSGDTRLQEAAGREQ